MFRSMFRCILCCLLCFVNTVVADGAILVFLGPPGSGKGTAAQYLKEKHGFAHISAGDLLRSEIDKLTPLGAAIAETVKRGEFIDPLQMHALLQTRIDEELKQCPYLIIDGFGRTKHDVQFLYQLFQELGLTSQVSVVYFEAADAVCAERIRNRLVCATCGHVYNMVTCPPIVEMQCDICGGSLKKRINDDIEVISKRIADYRKNTDTNYRLFFQLYPYTILNTNGSLEACLGFYNNGNFLKNGTVKDGINN